MTLASSSPEELERLAWEAWWSDDAATTFAAREAAQRAYLERADAAGAARAAIWARERRARRRQWLILG